MLRFRLRFIGHGLEVLGLCLGLVLERGFMFRFMFMFMFMFMFRFELSLRCMLRFRLRFTGTVWRYWSVCGMWLPRWARISGS